MAQTKIKVDRLKLIQAIRDAKTKEEERVAPLLAEFEGMQLGIRTQFIERLRQQLANAQAGGPLEAVSIPYDGKFYGRRPECKTFSMDRHVAMLEMCGEDVVAVNSEDFGVYFR